MARKRTPGLFKRNGIWHIDKSISGQPIRESSGASNLEEAERYLARRIETIRQASVYGVRPERLFREAAIKFLAESEHLLSLDRYARALKKVDPFIGDLPLNKIHMGTLKPYIDAAKKAGNKNRTINYPLQAIRRILNLATSEWLDEYGLTWLASAPKIKLLPQKDARKPYPLSWEEQNHFFNELPTHLKAMALFAVNTGCRETIVCTLRWDWEVTLPEIPGSILFIIPDYASKNGEERIVVVNQIASDIINRQRGQHPTYVFSYYGKPLRSMLNDGWKDARVRAGLTHLRVHDLKHTFGRRLRAAGVSFEDRQDLLGHKSGRITTHYSVAELKNLFEAVNKVCEQGESYPTLALLKRKSDYLNSYKNAKKKVIPLQPYAHRA